MQGKSYRLNAEILGIISKDNRRVTVMIPKEETLTVVNGPLNGNRMVDVLWRGDTVMVFAQDLRERGTALPETIRAIA